MNCDLIAPHYWWIERLGMGRTLERRRRWFLPEIGNARRALVLGDGDGRFLEASCCGGTPQFARTTSI